MELKLVRLLRQPIGCGFEAEISASFYDEKNSLLPDFGHFTVRLTEKEISNIPLTEIEQLAFTRVATLLK